MSTSIEAQGVTVDEAIQVALNRLGVSRDRVEIEILHHPRTGFLGIGARRAKVRATLRVSAFEDGAEYDMSTGTKIEGNRRRQSRRRRRGRGGGRERGAEQPTVSAAEDGTGAKLSAERPSQNTGRSRERRAGRQRPRAQRGGGRENRQTKAVDESAAVVAPPRAAPPLAAPSGAPLGKPDRDQIRARAVQIVTELVQRMGFVASATAEYDDRENELVVRVRSDAEALLIGRRGLTLDALEHILTRMMFPGESSSDHQIALDIGGYRGRRRESLLRLAVRLKAEAIARRRRILVGPMNPRDRKVLLGALAGDTAIEAQADGTGFYRRVQIAPAGARDENLPADVVADDDADNGDDGPLGGTDPHGVPD